MTLTLLSGHIVCLPPANSLTLSTANSEGRFVRVQANPPRQLDGPQTEVYRRSAGRTDEFTRVSQLLRLNNHTSSYRWR